MVSVEVWAPDAVASVKVEEPARGTAAGQTDSHRSDRHLVYLQNLMVGWTHLPKQPQQTGMELLSSLGWCR